MPYLVLPHFLQKPAELPPAARCQALYHQLLSSVRTAVTINPQAVFDDKLDLTRAGRIAAQAELPKPTVGREEACAAPIFGQMRLNPAPKVKADRKPDL